MSPASMNAFIQTLQAQRNTALDTIVQMSGEIADLNDRIRKVEEERDALKKEVEEMKNPPHPML